MDGTQILLELLLEDADLGEVVASGNIVPAPLPPGSGLPAIVLSEISGVDRNVPSPGPNRRVTERIQATAMAGNYPAMKDVFRLLRKAAADWVGTIADVEDVTVHTDSAGPSGMDADASIHMKPQDFIIGYTEVR